MTSNYLAKSPLHNPDYVVPRCIVLYAAAVKRASTFAGDSAVLFAKPSAEQAVATDRNERHLHPSDLPALSVLNDGASTNVHVALSVMVYTLRKRTPSHSDKQQPTLLATC
jgi:hypothetical protein